MKTSQTQTAECKVSRSSLMAAELRRMYLRMDTQVIPEVHRDSGKQAPGSCVISCHCTTHAGDLRSKWQQQGLLFLEWQATGMTHLSLGECCCEVSVLRRT